MKRRSFLRNATLAGMSLTTPFFCSKTGTGGETPSSEAQGPASLGGSDRRLGVALLGLGGYAGGQLAPALQDTRFCELRGIVTGTPDKIPTWQQKYGIKDSNVYSYDTLPSIADNADINVVYVVVPTGLHKKYAVMAAEAGKHVWCEKPMAMTVAECQQIIDACAQNGVELCVGYRMQHEDNTQKVIELAKTKPYGEIRSVRAEAGYCCLQTSSWRFDKELGGGALYDMGVYVINGLRYATGMEPVRVRRASITKNRPKLFTEVDETTEFELEFPNGLIGYGKTSVGESTNFLRVECADGWYELSPMQSYSGVAGRTSDGQTWAPVTYDQQTRQMDDDALSILTDRPILVPGSEGLRDIRIVNAIFESARTGKSVEIG